MPIGILIDEIHLTFRVPWRLPAKEQTAVFKALRGKRFRTRLRDAVDRVAKKFLSLRRARFSLSR